MSRTTRRHEREKSGTKDINITYDGLARVDGSARFGFGDTVALASISGPIEVRLASELPSKATFEVILRPLTNVPATDSKCLAATIRASLEPSLILNSNPRTLIQLVIQSLRRVRSSMWKDSLTAAMINASCLALLNSGSVHMRGMIAAVAIGRIPDGTLVINPDEEEEESLESGGCFAFMFADGAGLENDDTSNSDCVWSGWKSISGTYDESELFKARELARTAASDVYFAMKKSIGAPGARVSYSIPARNPTKVTKDEMKVEVEDEDEDEDDSDDDRMEI